MGLVKNAHGMIHRPTSAKALGRDLNREEIEAPIGAVFKSWRAWSVQARVGRRAI